MTSTSASSIIYDRILHNLRPVPYFVIYLFSRNCIREEADFQKFKPRLEACSDADVKLTWGNTQVMRIREIGEHLLQDGKISGNVLEIGCGEMDYPRAYLKSLSDEKTPTGYKYNWYAHDVVDYQHLASRVRERTKRENFYFTTDLSEIKPVDDLLLLMVETIEHMKYEQAVDYVVELLNKFHPVRALLTTPNHRFNQYFELDGFRHEDHQFELAGFDEMLTFVSQVFNRLEKNRSYTYRLFGVGDRVDDQYLTLGLELTRKGVVDAVSEKV